MFSNGKYLVQASVIVGSQFPVQNLFCTQKEFNFFSFLTGSQKFEG